MRRRPCRPMQLKGLIFLEGVNSVLLLLREVLLPVFLFHASQVPVEGKLLARLLVACVLSFAGLIVAAGLWMRSPAAFRMGFILAVFTLALGSVWIIVSLSSASFDLAPFLVFILNILILFFFLQPSIAAAMDSREKR